MALAYQFVFGTGDVLGFTREGRKRLNEVRRELRGLEDEGLTDDEISARVLELTDQIRDVLANDVIVRGPGRRDGPGGSEDDAGDRQEPGTDETTPDDLAVPDESEPLPDGSEPVPEEGEPVPEEELPEGSEQPLAPGTEGGETESTPPAGEPVSPDSSQDTTTP